RGAEYAFAVFIGAAHHILWQNILDTQGHASYTDGNEKQVLINYQYQFPGFMKLAKRLHKRLCAIWTRHIKTSSAV
ncbi:MAG: hypothetical protein WAO51_08800, partial [Bacillota bacterium]